MLDRTKVHGETQRVSFPPFTSQEWRTAFFLYRRWGDNSLLDPLLVEVKVVAGESDGLHSSLLPLLLELGNFTELGGADRGPAGRANEGTKAFISADGHNKA